MVANASLKSYHRHGRYLLLPFMLFLNPGRMLVIVSSLVSCPSIKMKWPCTNNGSRCIVVWSCRQCGPHTVSQQGNLQQGHLHLTTQGIFVVAIPVTYALFWNKTPKITWSLQGMDGKCTMVLVCFPVVCFFLMALGLSCGNKSTQYKVEERYKVDKTEKHMRNYACQRNYCNAWQIHMLKHQLDSIHCTQGYMYDDRYRHIIIICMCRYMYSYYLAVCVHVYTSWSFAIISWLLSLQVCVYIRIWDHDKQVAHVLCACALIVLHAYTCIYYHIFPWWTSAWPGQNRMCM